MGDELGIKIRVDMGDYSSLISGIKGLEGKIEPIKVKLDVGNAKQFLNVMKQVNTTLQGVNKAGSGSGKNSIIDTTNIKQAVTALNKYYLTLQKLKSSQYAGIEINLDGMKSAAQKVLGSIDTGVAVDDLKNLQVALSLVTGEMGRFDQVVKNANYDKNLEKSANSATRRIQTIRGELERIRRDYANLSEFSKTRIFSMTDESDEILQRGATDLDASKMGAQLAKLKADLEISGERVETLSQKVQRLFGEHFNTAVAMAGVHALQQAMSQLWQSVEDVDAAMTELVKVTNLSDSQINGFLDSAANNAKSLGASMSDYISSVADWARLGYSVSDAKTLANASQLYLNVGDDVDNMNESTSTLISTLRAFKMEASDAVGIVDKLNEVSNNYATSAGDIGDALARSSAALYAGGNSLEQSIALITAAQSTIQDADKVGTALKTISMYLRSTKADLEAAGESTEGMAETTSKLRSELLALSHGKVDIQLDADTYKSTYQILKDMSKAWADMTDMERAAATELMGGKRNSNIISALISDFEIAENALATATDSVGSATKENEHYLDSIAGKMSQFQAQFQSLSTTLLDSEVPKLFIDMGTGALSAFENVSKLVGVLPTLIGLLSGGLSLAGQKAGKVNMPSYASCDLIAA